jgi:beta-mannanase
VQIDDGDSFVPYWPGSDYVDWVGVSAYTWEDNKLAAKNRFIGLWVS